MGLGVWEVEGVSSSTHLECWKDICFCRLLIQRFGLARGVEGKCPPTPCPSMLHLGYGETKQRVGSSAFCPPPPYDRPCRRTHVTVHRCTRGRYTF